MQILHNSIVSQFPEETWGPFLKAPGNYRAR